MQKRRNSKAEKCESTGGKSSELFDHKAFLTRRQVYIKPRTAKKGSKGYRKILATFKQMQHPHEYVVCASLYFEHYSTIRDKGQLMW